MSQGMYLVRGAAVLYDLAIEQGLTLGFYSAARGGEWHSFCPKCGDSGKGQLSNRFRIQPYYKGKRCVGFYCCRGCEIQGDTISFCIDIMGMAYEQALARIGLQPTVQKPPMKHPTKTKLNSPTLVKPPLQWSKAAEAFVTLCQGKIFQRPDILSQLARRGINEDAIKKYGIGFWDPPKPKDQYRNKTAWGLPEVVSATGNVRPLWLPGGIVFIAREKSGTIIRVKIRRHEYKEGDKLAKYVAVSGSMNGLSIYGDMNLETMIVVESERDAIAIVAVAGEHVFAVAIGGCIKDPDNVVEFYAINKNCVLIIPDNDKVGYNMPQKWQALYSNARAEKMLPPIKVQATPIGKDIGEAIELGLDLKQWLLNVLSSNEQQILTTQTSPVEPLKQYSPTESASDVARVIDKQIIDIPPIVPQGRSTQCSALPEIRPSGYELKAECDKSSATEQPAFNAESPAKSFNFSWSKQDSEQLRMIYNRRR